MARAVLGSADAPVGLTPKELVWRKNKARLYRYIRSEPATHRTPIFLVLPLINRAYILDLRPGASFVEFLLSEGFDVFLIDWGTPGDEDRALDVTTLVTRYLPRAAKAIQRAIGRRPDDGPRLLHRRRPGDLLRRPPSRVHPQSRAADGAARLRGRRSVRSDDGPRRLPDRAIDRHVSDGAGTGSGHRLEAAQPDGQLRGHLSPPLGTVGRSGLRPRGLAGDVPLGERQRPVRRGGVPPMDRRVLPGEPPGPGHARHGRPAGPPGGHPLSGPQHRRDSGSDRAARDDERRHEPGRQRRRVRDPHRRRSRRDRRRSNRRARTCGRRSASGSAPTTERARRRAAAQGARPVAGWASGSAPRAAPRRAGPARRHASGRRPRR